MIAIGGHALGPRIDLRQRQFLGHFGRTVASTACDRRSVEGLW